MKEDENLKILHAAEAAAGGKPTSISESANTASSKSWWSGIDFWAGKGSTEPSKGQTPADRDLKKDGESK